MPKNIVILSDGTGNSAAKFNKTNVWRLYQALETDRPDRQIVIYDDGVGAQKDTRIAAIAGAFGFGLKRNVIELYAFLCRNYVPGDHIYLFGFSRGAFTVRLLAGLLLQRGVLNPPTRISESDLIAQAKCEYLLFRRSYDRAFFSNLFAKWIYPEDASSIPKHDPAPGVTFMGVWDTVDAYGLPIDEMADLWNKVIFQLKFDNQNLSPKVRRAAQALSIDDERLTFHPLVWNENLDFDGFDPAAPRDIRQVWFSGVHADVGGGYPEPALAQVSLEWMILQALDGAGPRALAFKNAALHAIHAEADPHGKEHNSRKGLAALYRYHPRYIDRLSDDPDGAHVRVARPKIHASVFERIRRDVTPYAPIALPEDYEVVTTDGMTAPEYEGPDERRARFARQERARDAVFWGRGVYNCFIGALIAFALLPFLAAERPPTDAFYAAPVGWVLDGAAWILPGFAHGWLDTWRGQPELFVGMLAVFVVLFVVRGASAGTIRRLANEAWIGGGPPLDPKEADGFTRELRRWLPDKINRIIVIGLLIAVPAVVLACWIL